MSIPYKNIHVVINPASGKKEPILNTINQVFHKHEIDWQVSITKQFGDATKLARQAIADGVDLVAGYGGDGTQMEIANAVMGGSIPMAILPGGTGTRCLLSSRFHAIWSKLPNLFVKAGIPVRSTLPGSEINTSCCEHILGLKKVKKPAANKDRFGNLAYIVDTLHTLENPPHAHYRLKIDDVEVEEEGLTCLILNAGSLGGIDLHATGRVDVSDGLLDVFIVNKNLSALRSLTSYLLDAGKAQMSVHHWQGKEISVAADPPQTSWIDGELYGPTPYTITAIPQGVPIVVPE